MSHLSYIAKNTFNKIFTNLSKEMGEEVNKIQLGIYYTNGMQKYEVYRNLKKEKDIELNKYVGSVIDFTGGTEVINATISQSGPVYAKELNCELDEISVIMQYKEKSLPMAVLMKKKEKVRNIDIEKEFLKG